MRLSALTGEVAVIRGEAGIEITGLASDSRKVRPGDLFVALIGGTSDGRKFIGDALTAGARAILADPSMAQAELPVPLVVDSDPRRCYALMAARFFAAQPPVIAAITGTNGKTSIAGFLRQLWSACGQRAASIGTLGVIGPDGHSSKSLTTPDPVDLHRALTELAGHGVDHLALEASSHGLDQRRLDGVRLTAAAFTDLTRDHLDYHGTPEAYLAAKLRLFDTLLPEGATAVLNADSDVFPQLEELCRQRNIAVIDVGRAADQLRLVDQTSHADGQRLTLDIHGVRHDIETRLVGGFQGQNLLTALGLLAATGGDISAAIGHLGSLRGAPGRMELVTTTTSGGRAFVDFAHTPDALEQALRALRPHTTGRLVVVVGCGGDRDPGKRPLMGRIAATLADRVIVSDDNPRSEDPARIRAAMLAACPGACEIGDRAEAITTALAELHAGDVLLVAGKGHETGQIVGDRVLPFDDAEVLRHVVTGAAA